MNHQLIHHFLEQSAERYPDKIALIHEETRATYAEINFKANQLAQHLVDSGVQPSDRVVILLENSLDYVVSYYGTLKAGAVAVPLSTGLKPDGLNHLLAELEPAAIIYNDRFKRLLDAADQSLIKNSTFNIQHFDFKECIPAYSTNSTAPKLIKNLKRKIKNSSLASIIYTSGSTGRAKGVMLTHQNIVANVHAICESLSIVADDVQMVVLPFFYVMGKSLLNAHFAAGATVIINNKFAYPATVLNQMVEEKVTSFSGVPSTYAYLLHRSPLKQYRDKLTSLRYCSQAGGHMSRRIKTELRKVLPEHTDIYIMYGATEASSRLTCLEPKSFDDKIDSIGKPIPDVSIDIVDDNGNILEPGKIGELVARGANMTAGYWRNPGDSRSVLDGNGYHTGDLGYQDDDGFIFVTGRRDNIVKVGGHKINPQAVEDTLMETGLLVEAVVLAAQDEFLGNKLIAVGTPINGDIEAQQVMGSCAQRLPQHMIPADVILLRSLPKNKNGKVDKNACEKIAAKTRL